MIEQLYVIELTLLLGLKLKMLIKKIRIIIIIYTFSYHCECEIGIFLTCIFLSVINCVTVMNLMPEAFSIYINKLILNTPAS